MVLDGRIERPRVDLFLDRPNDAMGFSDMRLLLLPTAAGFDYASSGGRGSGRSPATGRSCCPTAAARPSPSPRSMSAGRTASGDLRSDPGGFTGTLAVAGGGLDGELDFAPVGDAQQIEAHLRPATSAFPAFSRFASGRLDGTIMLADGRTTLDGVVDARGFEASGMTLRAATANAQLVNGSGQVRAAIAGRRGAAFEFTTLANVTPDSIQLTGRGADRAPAAGTCARRRC